MMGPTWPFIARTAFFKKRENNSLLCFIRSSSCNREPTRSNYIITAGESVDSWLAGSLRTSEKKHCSTQAALARCIQANLAKMLLELEGRLWQPQKLETLRAGPGRIAAFRLFWPGW